MNNNISITIAETVIPRVLNRHHYRKDIVLWGMYYMYIHIDSTVVNSHGS